MDADLGYRLEELKDRHGSTVRLEDIAEVVTSLLASLHGDLSVTDLEIFSELESLASYIHAAKAEIAALRPDEVRDEFLPKAADELDAIVEATADATNTIMDATEAIEGVMGDVPQEIGDVLMEATTRIYEACGFQDITGQRITKVVKALKHIEERIDALVAAFGTEIDKYKASQAAESSEPPADKPAASEVEEAPGAWKDEELLHGPQLKGEGRSQDEIDALLASFD